MIRQAAIIIILLSVMASVCLAADLDFYFVVPWEINDSHGVSGKRDILWSVDGRATMVKELTNGDSGLIHVVASQSVMASYFAHPKFRVVEESELDTEIINLFGGKIGLGWFKSCAP